MNKWLGLWIALISSSAFAVVDMKNANYADTWTDLSLGNSGFNLEIKRTYNSRSQFSGIFGYGWCSDLETKVEITPEGNLLLTECGGGLQISYFPDDYDQDSINKFVDEIIKRAKDKNKNAKPKYFETLSFQLRQDDELRSIWAKEMGLTQKSLKGGSKFLANGKEVDRIEFDGSTYERSLADGTKQKYSKSGRIQSIQDKNQNFIKFVYADDLIKEIVDNNGKKLTFKFDPNKKLKSINGPNNLKAEYEFKNEDLISVRNAWGNLFTFKYDATHNLTRIDYPDKTAKVLTYDQTKDWVTSFKDRNACEETYTYSLSKNDPQNQYSASAVRKCKGQITNKASHEFVHRTRADGKKFLFKIKSVTNSENLEIVYHDLFGKPVSIKKNGTVTAFAYYPNGLIKEKTTDAFTMEYKYKNALRKVSEVVTRYPASKGKAGRQVVYEFEYDKRGNLIEAQNSEGQKVTLKYDDRGRLASLTDQARKEVYIKYDEKTGKPSQITRPKLGSINITYGPDGTMKKTDSKEGTVVAMQIASAFNNFLDVVSPASNELTF